MSVKFQFLGETFYMQLLQHQIDASNWIATTPTKAGIIAHITGSGKSVTTISGALKLYATRHVKKHIVVATVSSISEIMNDMVEHFHYKFFEIKNESDFITFMTTNKVMGILKYGVLKRIDPHLIEDYVSKYSTAMYFDEAHELKNEETVIQTHVRVYREKLEGLFLVTATPVMSSAKDLQGLFWLINPQLLGDEETFYKLFSKFRRVSFVKRGEKRHCRCGGYSVFNGSTFRCSKCGNTYEPKKHIQPISYKNQDVLAKLVAPYINSFFPPRDLRYYKIVTELNSEQNYQYDLIAQAVMTGGEEQHSSRMIKLQHYLDNSEIKKEILKKLVAQLRKQGVIIYSDYLDTVDVIEDTLKPLGVEIRSITGKLNAKARKEVRNWFRSGAENKVLIITKAGGASLNLQSTNNLIFYDIPFSVGNFIQVVGRVARYFSDFKHYNIFFPVIKDTLDDYKFTYVSSRKELIEDVLQNKCLPQGELESYNADLLKQIRSRTLWKRDQR